MVENGYMLLKDLMQLINKSNKESNDVMIANIFIQNRYKLDEMSLDDIARKYYISQASLSRFIKKMGYKNYNSFRNDINLSCYYMKFKVPTESHFSLQEIKEKVYQDISQVLENIHSLDTYHVQRVLDLISNYQNIYFFGSELSMAIVYIIQLVLTSLKKNVYTIYDINYQREVQKKLNQDDLVICISIEGRWYETQRAESYLFQTKAYKMLWTLDSNHVDKESFDNVYIFGKDVKYDLGYNELMYFVYFIYQALLSDSFKK